MSLFETCKHVPPCCSQHSLPVCLKHSYIHITTSTVYKQLLHRVHRRRRQLLQLLSAHHIVRHAHQRLPSPSSHARPPSLRFLHAPQRRRQRRPQRHQRLQPGRALGILPRDHRRLAHFLLPLPRRTPSHPRGSDTPAPRGSRQPAHQRGTQRRPRPRVLPVRFHGFPYDLRYPRGSAAQRVLAVPGVPAIARRAFHRRNPHGGERRVPRNSRGEPDSRAGRVVRRIR